MEENTLIAAQKSTEMAVVIPFRKGREISWEEYWSLFHSNFPGWDHAGDDFLIYNTKLYGPTDEIRDWLSGLMEGDYRVGGVYCNGYVEVSFQFKKDMEKASNRW